ncbi:MAG: threonine aldolase [Candidatus Eremiobacteraeota bacterium]|nr:threonine aldolase [Candidatus Eremiobacteraeota bacterium]
MADDLELTRLRASCPRALTGRLSQTPREALLALADETPGDIAFDTYGAGAWLAAFEARVASELGKEAAVFMPTGTLAQQIALRIWCDRAKNRTSAFHPTCHLEIHESRGYARLHDLHALPVGAPAQLMTVLNGRELADPLGAFLIELPQREIGAQLPPWNELVALCEAARATGAKLHMDGARLWEAAPFYNRSHAEISALFDRVYVSFYKGLGALAGAMLAGPEDFIALARVWQHRHGGRPYTIAPFALSAERGFQCNLPKMRAFRERALEIAVALDRIDGVSIVPSPPQTNTFHIFLRGERETLETRAHAYAREHGTFVFARLAPTVVPSSQKWEFAVGDATMALSVEDVATAVEALF